MWDEERQRCGGTGPPPPPPDPPRDPHPLCTTVDTIRAEFQVWYHAQCPHFKSALLIFQTSCQPWSAYESAHVLCCYDCAALQLSGFLHAGQAIADAHAQDVASACAAAAPSGQPSQASPEKQPSARLSSSMPTSQDSLLRQTQAANLILSTEGPSTPHAQSNAPGNSSPEPDLGRFPEASEAIASFPGFPEAGTGLHGDVVRPQSLLLSSCTSSHFQCP